MKRIVCLLLSTLLMFGLFAGCGQEQEGQTGNETVAAFSVGYGKADISPETSVYLIGFGEDHADRMSTGVAEHLYATALAFTDAEGETVLFIATDLLYIREAECDPIREMIEQETGVPYDHIIITNSHNHSGPEPDDPIYLKLLQERLLQSAKDALADRAPAQMYTTFSRPEGYVYVRHYLMNDGTYRGEKVGGVKKDVIGHTHKCDNLLQLVKFTREGKKDIVMMNWKGHPWGNEPISYTTATSNYPGVMRATVEQELDCLGVFVLGASGNSNNGSQIPEEDTHGHRYLERGQDLGMEAVKAAENFAPAKVDNIQFEENVLLRDNNRYGADFEVPLYAFSIGDVAFITAPFETFDTNEVFVREGSKFPMTIYASVTNDWQSYLPTPESWPWEEHYEVRITQYGQGMAEDVAEQQLAMLNRLFEAAGYEETEKAPGYLTPEFVPASDGTVYLNPTPGQLDAIKEVANGFYQLVLLKGSTAKIMLAVDRETAEKVMAQETMELLLNEQNVIVGVAP